MIKFDFPYIMDNKSCESEGKNNLGIFLVNTIS